MNTRMLLAASVCALASSIASADTITGSFTKTLFRDVTVSLDAGEDFDPVTAITARWTRSDTPGPGVDSLLPSTFRSYCIEFEEFFSPNVTYTYSVISPAAHGLNPTQIDKLTRLWTTYQPIVDTANESAAFQLAVWEIVEDNTDNLNAGNFRVSSPTDVKTLASAWLSTVYAQNSALPLNSQLVVLSNPNKQDQITLVPSPATGVLAGLGALALRSRRRRTA
jgi:hypothetical protein